MNKSSTSIWVLFQIFSWIRVLFQFEFYFNFASLVSELWSKSIFSVKPCKYFILWIQLLFIWIFALLHSTSLWRKKISSMFFVGVLLLLWRRSLLEKRLHCRGQVDFVMGGTLATWWKAIEITPDFFFFHLTCKLGWAKKGVFEEQTSVQIWYTPIYFLGFSITFSFLN